MFSVYGWRPASYRPPDGPPGVLRAGQGEGARVRRDRGPAGPSARTVGLGRERRLAPRPETPPARAGFIRCSLRRGERPSGRARGRRFLFLFLGPGPGPDRGWRWRGWPGRERRPQHVRGDGRAPTPVGRAAAGTRGCARALVGCARRRRKNGGRLAADGRCGWLDVRPPLSLALQGGRVRRRGDGAPRAALPALPRARPTPAPSAGDGRGARTRAAWTERVTRCGAPRPTATRAAPAPKGYPPSTDAALKVYAGRDISKGPFLRGFRTDEGRTVERGTVASGSSSGYEVGSRTPSGRLPREEA